MSEVELKPLTHKARKDYIKEMRTINKEKDEEAKYDKLMEFREGFLKKHLAAEVDLDTMPSKEVDKLFETLEGDMDFHMGLKALMSLNIAPSSESLPSPKVDKK